MTTAIHGKQTISDGIHSAISLAYSDEAARLADSGFDAGDLYKLAYQLSDDSVWLLSSVSPVTWTAVNPDASNVVYGTERQVVVSEAEVSTTQSVFQVRTTLVTPVLSGTYEIQWQARVGQSGTGDTVETRLWDDTNAVQLGTTSSIEPKDVTSRYHVGETLDLAFSNESRRLQIQWREQNGGTAFIAGARIRIMRVA